MIPTWVKNRSAKSSSDESNSILFCEFQKSSTFVEGDVVGGVVSFVVSDIVSGVVSGVVSDIVSGVVVSSIDHSGYSINGGVRERIEIQTCP